MNLKLRVKLLQFYHSFNQKRVEKHEILAMGHIVCQLHKGENIVDMLRIGEFGTESHPVDYLAKSPPRLPIQCLRQKC